MARQEKRIRAVIVDDEKGCIANLRHHINRYCPAIEVVATAGSTTEMHQIFGEYEFDIAFLDIELFDTSIFDLLPEASGINYEIVFVTAYEQYAVKAFRIEALDYLLKPLTQADVANCYARILKRFGEKPPDTGNETAILQNDALKRVIIRLGENVHAIKQEDILYLKAKGFYTQVLFSIHGRTEQAIISKPIGSLEKEYDSILFYRVHKSYLVNLNKVTGVVKTGVTCARISNNEVIPVAKRRVNDFMTALKRC